MGTGHMLASGCHGVGFSEGGWLCPLPRAQDGERPPQEAVDTVGRAHQGPSHSPVLSVLDKPLPASVSPSVKWQQMLLEVLTPRLGTQPKPTGYS